MTFYDHISEVVRKMGTATIEPIEVGLEDNYRTDYEAPQAPQGSYASRLVLSEDAKLLCFAAFFLLALAIIMRR